MNTSSVPIETFRVSISSNDSDVTIVSLASVDASMWSQQVAMQSNSLAVTGSFIRTGDVSGAAASGTVEQLADVTLSVFSGALNQKAIGITVTLLYLSDMQQTTLVSNETQAIIVDRRGVSNANTSGSGSSNSSRCVVVLGLDQVVGLLPYAQRGEIVNTALLSGQATLVPISIFGIYSNPLRAPSVLTTGALNTAGVFCSSYETRAAKTSSNCAFIQVDSFCTFAAAAMPITVGLTTPSVQASFPINVWAPITPIDIQLSNYRLRRLSFLTSRWQTASVTSITARFTNTIATYNVSVDDIVRNVLAPTDGSVLSFSNGIVGATGAGVAAVAVRGIASLGAATVTVDNSTAPADLARVIGIDLSIASSISLALAATQPASPSLSALAPYRSTPGGSVATAAGQLRLDTLTAEGDLVVVTAEAVFGDQSRMPLTAADGLVWSSHDEDSLALDTDLTSGNAATFVVPAGAVSRANLPILAEWQPFAGNDTAVARALTYVNVSVLAASSVTVTGVPLRLAPSGSAANLAGVPASSSAMVIKLLYPNGRVVDATADPRTVVEVLAANNGTDILVASNPSGNQPVLAPKAGGGAGVATVRVSFTHEAVVLEFNVTVVKAVDLTVAGRPFPAYSGSTSVSRASLRPINNTAPTTWQQASLVLTLQLSDSSTIDLTANSAVTVALTDATSGSATAQLEHVFSSSTHVLRVPTSNGATGGTVNVAATFGGQTSVTPLALQLLPDPLRVVGLEGLSLDGASNAGSDFSGAAGTSGGLRGSVVLSDGSRLDGVLLGAALPSLLQVTSGVSDAITANSTAGTLSLHGNHHAEVGISIAVIGGDSGASGSLSLRPNLQAGLGDIDIGSQTGLSASPLNVGSTRQLPVYANLGSSLLSAFEIVLTYDADRLDIDNVTKAYASGVFDAFINDAAGRITISGVVLAPYLTGSLAQLFTITVTATGTAGPAELTGTLNVLSQPDFVGSPIGQPGPRAIVAGAIRIPVASSADLTENQQQTAAASAPTISPYIPTASPQQQQTRRRRLLSSAPANGARVRRSSSGCPVGDVNGDCKFDANDVSFLLAYMAQVSLNPPSAIYTANITSLHTAKPYTLTNMDADHDGVTTERDASFLNKVGVKEEK